MINKHDKEVNQIAKWNLLHDIINNTKRAKDINTHYSIFLHGYMNTIKVRDKFKNSQIIFDSGCSSIIVMERLVEN